MKLTQFFAFFVLLVSLCIVPKAQGYICESRCSSNYNVCIEYCDSDYDCVVSCRRIESNCYMICSLHFDDSSDDY